MKILVAGGAGYIGGVMIRHLLEAGHIVAVVDNLVSGHRESIPAGVAFHEMDLRSPDFPTLLRDIAPEAVMHFAASISVGESVQEPWSYHDNNVGGMMCLLRAMHAHSVKKLIFSSTAAVYGDVDAEQVPIAETTNKAPINPYGVSKLYCETLIESACEQWGLRATALRYFNASGASAISDFGEAHKKEEHLIPRAVLFGLGMTTRFAIFGNDFETEDGTCIRDYVHVDDLARAHALALNAMSDRDGFHAYNVGSGTGYSVSQVVRAVGEALGHKLDVAVAQRREGDPAVLIADSSKLRAELGWKPELDNIEAIVASALQWHRSPRYAELCPNACE